MATLGTALPDLCTNHDIFDMNALDAVHRTSYCIVESTIEEANSESEQGVEMDCSPDSLYRTEGQDETSTFLMSCLLQEVRRPGDDLPLSADKIKERISSAATKYLEGAKVEDCSPRKLKGIQYEDALDSKGYSECMQYETLKDLTHPEKLKP